MLARWSLILSFAVVMGAGCAKEEPQGQDTLGADTQENEQDTQSLDITDTQANPDLSVPSGSCSDVANRYKDWTRSHQSCSTVDDCVIVELAESCDCHYSSVVNKSAQSGAETLMSEANGCGMSASDILGCAADVAPVSQLECRSGRCNLRTEQSCLSTTDVFVDTGQ